MSTHSVNVRMHAEVKSFYRAMQRRVRYCHGKSSPCLSLTLRRYA